MRLLRILKCEKEKLNDLFKKPLADEKRAKKKKWETVRFFIFEKTVRVFLICLSFTFFVN